MSNISWVYKFKFCYLQNVWYNPIKNYIMIKFEFYRVNQVNNMLNIHIKDDFFNITNIDKTSIQKIYSIYRNSDDFKYATGFFQSIEYEQFAYNISQFIQRDNIFFLDIRLNSGETIGLIKGLTMNRDNVVWINSMIIDTPYQRKGYGIRVVGLLQEYLKRVCLTKKIYLSVYKSNMSGINFWTKCGFNDCNEISNKDDINFNENVQIMCKLL